MYDKSLKYELQQFKVDASNIYELQNRYQNIIKIIRNRTNEKIELVKYMQNYDGIDVKICKELYGRIKADYKEAYLYLFGL